MKEELWKAFQDVGCPAPRKDSPPPLKQMRLGQVVAREPRKPSPPRIARDGGPPPTWSFYLFFFLMMLLFLALVASAVLQGAR